MKQLLQNLRTGETTVVEVPIPTPGSGAALVRTAASLISAGTERTLVEFAGQSLLGKARARPDLVRQVMAKARREGLLTAAQAAFNRLDRPLPLGYSSAGTIVALGEGMQSFQVGQRVACAGGGHAVHAEYAVVPRRLLAVLPEAVDFESAAFATLGAIALHGFRLSGCGLGDRVAVIGLGVLGLLAVGVASAAGCSVLGIDLEPTRVALAERMGANLAAVRDRAEEAAAGFSRGQGCDAVLVCADTPSADPVELAGAIARDRAHVVAIGAVGLNLPRRLYYEKELTFINSRSYGPGRYDPEYEEKGRDYPIGYVRWTEGRNLEAFVELLAKGKIDVLPLVSHRIPIQRAPEAYELIAGRRQEPSVGVLLTYPQTTSAPQTLAAAEEGRPSRSERAGFESTVRPPQPVTAPPRRGRAEPLRLGVLGAGDFASGILLPLLRRMPSIELVGIASASGLRARHAARRFGFRHAASEGGEGRSLLDDPEIDAIAVLTPHHLHAAQVLAALSAGKHVFCEKPLAIRAHEVERLARTLEELGEPGRQPEGEAPAPPSPAAVPLLMAGFNRRFAPLALRLQAFLAGRSEPLFAHYRVNAGYLPPTHWLHDPERGGGRLVGEGCHFIDFLAFLVGAPPVAVLARALPDRGRYCEDNVALTFAFPDGSLGALTYLANGDKAFSKERIEVFCGGRVAVLEDFRSLETSQGGRRQAFGSPLRQDKGHRRAWEAFVAAVAAGGPPPIPYDHLIGVAYASLAAVQALRSGEETPIVARSRLLGGED